MFDEEYSIEMGDFEFLDAKKDESLDVIMSSDCLCFCVDKDKLMDQMTRIIKPGGVIIFTDYLKHPNAGPVEI